MNKAFLVITSIADDKHPVLNEFSLKSKANNIPFILIGDTKSPDSFEIEGCSYYSIKLQTSLEHSLVKDLPVRHYARKNIGYLEAISKGAEIIIETDDDNYPMDIFFEDRTKIIEASLLSNKGWVNVYKYFTDEQIWPRGFALDFLQNELPERPVAQKLSCPIQQGLADKNPDVDAIYRLTFPLPFKFNKSESIALTQNTICPFNSQNTTWFKEAFQLLYLPSYCSFRMTDIWRSFVAQRIASTCDWPILFHKSTVWQERNDHNLMDDFKDEIPGYINNAEIVTELTKLDLDKGKENIAENLIRCYQLLVNMSLIKEDEIKLVKCWNQDIKNLLSQ